MRRITHVQEGREECLRRANDHEWHSENCPDPGVAAWCHEQARKWRSLALIAQPKR